MRNLFKLSASFLLILGLIGCGGSSSDSAGSGSSLSVETQKSTINKEKDEMGIDFSVKSNYGSDIGVNLHDLAINVTPCKVEQVVFSPNEIVFNENIEEKSVHAIVRFKEACTPTSYLLNGTTKLSLDGKTNELVFSSTEQEVTPEENQTVTTVPVVSVDTNSSTENNESNESSVDTINYEIKFSLEEEDVMKFNLKDKKSIQVSLIDKDTGNFIPNEKIINFKITSKQDNLLKLFDSNKNSVPSGLLSYEKINDIVIYAQTNTRSGLADIDVEIEYLNTNGGIEKIKKTYSTMIMSGPPTAFSINTAGILYNFETKWFENKFLISAVDRYNNVVNISPTIYISAMTGFTRDSRGKEVLYGNFGNVEGKLKVDKESKVATFEASSKVFDNIDVNRDYLYVFGQVDDYEALGKWDIDSYESSHTDTTLALSEAFNGENHDKLGFALGHNYLIDPGSSESREWQVKIDSTDGKYQLDEEGKAFVTLKFPYYLVGKRTALAVNFLGKTPETGKILRSGEVKFKTLHSFQGVIPPDAISVDKNTTRQVRVYFDIDTGTEDIWPVLNSHVSCKTKTSNIVDLSFFENTIVSTVEEFKRYGEYKAYWDLTLKASEDKDGSFTFEECHVRRLPRF